jgi:hypothetical protein
MTYKAIRLFASAIMLVFAAPALATTVLNQAVFDFTTGSNYGVRAGDPRYFDAVSPLYGTFRTRVTAWSLKTVGSTTTIYASKLMVYPGGLGIISGDDGTGDQNQHTIDNHGRKDFLLFQFNMPTILLSATFNTYSVKGGTKDSDAIFKYGMLWGPATDPYSALSVPLNLNGKNVSVLNPMFDGEFTSLAPNGASNTRDLEQHTGNFWLVGADFTNVDGYIDGFKFTNLAVVPEPSTWAMMICGFGLMGAVIRRRSRRLALSPAMQAA